MCPRISSITSTGGVSHCSCRVDVSNASADDDTGLIRTNPVELSIAYTSSICVGRSAVDVCNCGCTDNAASAGTSGPLVALVASA